MNRSYIKHIAALLLFGSNGVVASCIPMNSYEIVLLRTLLGSLLLFLLFFLTRGKFTFWRQKRDFCFLCLSGAAMGVSWILLFEAYGRIGVSIASLLYYCGPVIVMALSPLLFREKLTVFRGIGFLLVFAGLFLVNGNAAGSMDPFGFLCGLLSAVLYALMVIFQKKAARITGLENAALQLLVSFLAVAVFVACRQGFLITIPTEGLWAIFVLGLLNTGLGCYCYFSSIGDLPVQTVAICGYLEPLSAVVFSVLFLGETMSLLQIAGAVLLLGGAALGQFGKIGRKGEK